MTTTTPHRSTPHHRTAHHGTARRFARRAAVAVLAGAGLLATLAPSASAAAPAAPVAPAADRAALDAALRAVVGEGGSSAVLAEVRKDGRTTWRGAAGVADLATGAPVPEDARFRIGSVTKTFAATVVLQLVGERRIGLDDPVERHLPGLVPNGAAITVRQLLNHTSGIYSFTDDPRFATEGEEALDRWLTVGRWTTYRPVEVVRIATAQPPYSAPGAAWHYSNTNYVLLGMIIEHVTGRGWDEEIERRIVRPLGLRGTSMPGTSPVVPGPHAHGYVERPSGGPADVTLQNPSAYGAAGAGISTTRDLARFNAALLDGRLLRPAELAAMKQQVATGGDNTYGLGLSRYPTACGEFWGLTGGIAGYGTLVMGDAAGRRQVVVSINPYHVTEATGRTFQALVDTAACGSGGPTAG
ncbi:serine hydrolase domain-containing protein [Streptomyces sp. XY431]|uniref:serine hydrolase domain-containing protein n=1 Tax=Streptomyces sp. XY431 TaxID=1415562 RepID=UPI0006AFE67B|nr:serine hydrolase domain-containing protein [Streptomyces sp. XY431]